MFPEVWDMLDPASGYEALLTKDLARWRERITALNNEIAVKTRERDDLSRRVDAAEVLLGRAGEAADGEQAALRNHIKEVMSDGHIRKPKEIRRDLIARGIDPERISSRSGAFYNSLSRLVIDEDLARDDESRYWDPKKSQGPSSSNMEDMLK
jgi:ElaB/YqjD/DUF883 family membrane-anchored ribosome-binding protein